VRPTIRPIAEVRTDIESHFPGLVGTKWTPTSPYDDTYQCIAWAAGDTTRKWWPVNCPPAWFWPDGIPLIDDVVTFVRAFETLGYKPTTSSAFRIGRQKVAIYAKLDGTVTHMSRQHFLGRGWLSKLGDLEDIVHPTLESIEGDPSPTSNEYGIVVQILQRDWWTASKFGLFKCWSMAFKLWFLRPR